MPLMKAVFFMIFVGVPVSLSFLTTLGAASRPVTTPVALIRHPCKKHFQIFGVNFSPR